MLNPLSEADSWAQLGGNHNTERKTTSDLRRFSEWLRAGKGETRQPEHIPPAELDELLAAYFLDVRKLHNGEEYEPDSLAAIQRSIDRHLRGRSYCCSITTDPRFKYSNECLLFKKKSLKAAGKGGHRPNKAEPVSPEEVQFLLDKRLLGPYSAESLINSLWYVNTVRFGIKGQRGHTTLLWGDVEKKVDACGREYIEYQAERTSKTLSGRTGEPRPSPEPPRAWGDPNNPLLCPVRLYDEYAKRRPPQSTYPTTRFYLSKYHGKRDDVWFIDIPMGKNTVGQIMKVMATKAYGAILNESGLNDLESRHLAKRAKQNHNDTGEGSSISEDSSDGYEVVEDPPSNQMNNSLVSLYRKGNPDSAASSPKREPSAMGSPATVSTPVARTRAPHPSAATQVSAGGWFIDKRPEQNILIDLSEEDPASPAVKEEGDVSMLEPQSTKTKGKLKKSKKRKGEIASVDGDIESSILNKKAKTKAPELQYSTVKFEDVGGNDATLTELCKLLIHMRHPEVYNQLGVVPPRGFLLHGPPGCGKTLMAQAVAGELELPMLKVSAPELVSGVSGESEQKLRELFEQAVTSAPCILFIDEIDSITPKREVASKDMERRIVAQLLTCMDDLNSLTVTAQVLVIGATNRPDSLDPALRRAGRFDREICLGIPDEAARLRILKTLCRKLKLPEDFDYQQLARLTPGYVGADLMALCREAAMCAVNRVLLENQSQVQIESPCSTTDLPASAPPCTAPVKQELELVPQTPEQQGELARLLQLLKSTESVSEEQLAGLSILMTDFQASLASVQPSAKREGFATVPDVTWEDVGALQDIREELTMAILAPVRSPEQFKALGLNAPAGVLLAGPPGCGKTLLAKAVANESGLNFISVKGPELLNMYVGESERAVRQVFQRGRNSAPCVIFFDEIDALCPRRSGHESGAGVRVVNQLLTEMDGLECRRQVFIMAATNRPDIIDPAVLRPGRLDKTLYVGLPPPQDRHAILLTITKGGSKPPLEQDVSLEEIAHDDRCDCFTGADLSALVREASVNALRAHLKSQCTPSHSGHVFSTGVVADIRVSKQNFEDAFTKVRPSVSKKDQRLYEQLKEALST